MRLMIDVMLPMRTRCKHVIETLGDLGPPALQHDHLVSLLRAAGAKAAVVLGKNGEIDFWDRVVPALREAGVGCVTMSIGGWGVRELTFVYFLGAAGVTAEAALSLSVAFGLLRMVVGVIGGIAWVLLNEDHFRVDAISA